MDKVAWFELPADDMARANKFYSSVFGWETGPMGDTGSYYAMTAPSEGDEMQPLEPGSINGDISPRSQGFDKPLIVLDVVNIDERLEQVVAAGGKIALPRQNLEGMNMAWAIVTDTEGNNIGLTQDI